MFIGWPTNLNVLIPHMLAVFYTSLISFSYKKMQDDQPVNTRMAITAKLSTIGPIDDDIRISTDGVLCYCFGANCCLAAYNVHARVMYFVDGAHLFDLWRRRLGWS
jgi:hypothetical protein